MMTVAMDDDSSDENGVASDPKRFQAWLSVLKCGDK
jgi:hypothetical protein